MQKSNDDCYHAFFCSSLRFEMICVRNVNVSALQALRDASPIS
jgi:hypothetical protein